MIPESILSIDMNARLDNKIDANINQLIENAGSYQYSVADLNKKVNDEETLEEYIRDTEHEFGLEKRELSNLTSQDLTSYVAYLDSLWEV